MKLPEINVDYSGIWESWNAPIETQPRFCMHYELEIFLTDSGACSIDDHRVDIRRGTVVFARPGQIRHSRLPLKNCFINFDTAPHNELDALLRRIPDFSEPDESRIERFMKIVDNFPANMLLVSGILLEILSDIASSEPVRYDRIPKIGQSEIQESIHFMTQNLDKRLTAAELAARTGYCVPHYTARFKELTGYTPCDFFLSLRLNEAKRLLACDELSVSEVAERLSLGSPSHFSQLFRGKFKMTPTEFVKNARKYNNYYLG